MFQHLRLFALILICLIPHIALSEKSLFVSYKQWTHPAKSSFGFIGSVQDHSLVEVIPHPLFIQQIPEQDATANVDFHLDLSRKIAYYDENVEAGMHPVVSLSPSPELIGLSLDASTGVLQGRPMTTGVYWYRLHASNELSKAEPRDFVIKIAANPHDTPRFGEQRSLPPASPGMGYDMDLTTLLANNAAFNAGNPVSFTITEGSVDDDNNWLTIKNGTHLVGRPDTTLAGKTVKITLIAHSNTGGDSEPATITIPIAYDPALRPEFTDDLFLQARAGADFNYDLQGFIHDPMPDGSLRVVIDDVKPAAPWLSVDNYIPTRLIGMVPPQAVGVPYTVTAHAVNMSGGNSDKVLIPLKIVTDPDRVPRFNATNPVLPMLYPGQPFFHDFVANSDIYPSYDDAPYTVSFAEGFPHPSWLKLANNQLYAEAVPDDCYEDVPICLVIKNTPGGESKPIPLDIFTMY